MENLILILKGIVIGVAKIIPGVSGSCLAVSLNVYEEAIRRFNNIFSDFKNNLIFFISLGGGIILAILFGSKIMLYLYNKIPYYLISFFVGLLFGTIKDFTNKHGLKTKDYFVVSIIFLILILIYQNVSFPTFIFSNNFKSYLFVYLLGIVEAITMFIPGLSGTATYMMLGSYQFILALFAHPFNNILVLIIFMISFLLSSFIVINIIFRLFNKYYIRTWCIIFSCYLFSIYFLVLQIIDSLCKYNFFPFLLLIVGGYCLSSAFIDN